MKESKHKQEREKKKRANDRQSGAKGGKPTAKRLTLKDPEYRKRIAAMVATRIV